MRAVGRSTPPKTVGMVSLGCPKNLVDGEVMLGRLQGAGYELVADPKQADVIVVNTCAFIDRAKQESVDAILEMAREKEIGHAQRLVVTGCLTQRYDAELRREIPEIDATLGTGQVEGIVEAVGGRGDLARRGRAGPADLGLRPPAAPRAVDAALARVRQDQRGLRLHLLVLHHPDAAREAPQPRRRGHRGRGARPRRARRARARARRPGLDALRPRPRRARRPRLPAQAPRARRRASAGSG